MLTGKHIKLRLIKQADLAELYAKWHDAEIRGAYYPLAPVPEPQFYQAFSSDGFWNDNSKRLLITDTNDKVLGLIHAAKASDYSDSIDLSYIIFATEARNKGCATEAVLLLVDYLFNNYRLNRLQIAVPAGNQASAKVAEKAGFTHEGVAREGFLLNGKNVDLHIYSLLRREWLAIR
jgi:ribosomal-protein-alanine N-acetyltransferase